MRYSVELTEPAEKNIEESHDWLYAEAPEAAIRWIDGLRGAIESLANFPMRCPLAPESDDHPEDIRQLLYGRYRILFVIQKRQCLCFTSGIPPGTEPEWKTSTKGDSQRGATKSPCVS